MLTISSYLSGTKALIVGMGGTSIFARLAIVQSSKIINRYSSKDSRPSAGPKGFAEDRDCIHRRVFGSLSLFRHTGAQKVEAYASAGTVQTSGDGGWKHTNSSGVVVYYNRIVADSGSCRAEGYLTSQPTRREFMQCSASVVGNECIVHVAHASKLASESDYTNYACYTTKYRAIGSATLWDGSQCSYCSSALYGQKTINFPDPQYLGSTIRPTVFDFGVQGDTTFDVRTFGGGLTTACLTPDDNLVSPAQWGDLSFSAIQNATPLSINTTQFLREVISLESTVKSAYQLIQGNVTPKNLAKMWLSIKYGLRLTLKDASELGRVIGNALTINPRYTYCRSMGSTSKAGVKYPWVGGSISTEYHTKIYYTPYDDLLLKAVNLVWNLDGILKLENIWDFVPYSFVVDWFVSIGDILAKIDARTYASTLNINSVLKSTRTTYQTGLLRSLDGGIQVSGNLSAVHFTRWMANTFDPWEIFRLESPGSFKNLLELTSILVLKA